MVELIKLRDKKAAQLLGSFLRYRDIAAEMRKHPDGWQLLVPGEKLADATQLLVELKANPGMLNQTAWQKSDATEAGVSSVRLSSGMRRFSPLVLLVVGLCVLVYLSPFLFDSRIYDALFFPDQMSDLASEPWRLFTPALLHFSIIHITFNLVWWLDLGSAIEKRQSPWHLLVLALLVAAISNTAQFLVSGPNFGGLSGVVYGVLAYVWLWGKVRPQAGLALPPVVAMLMLGWLLLCWTGVLGPVANIAHLAGLLSGLLVAIGALMIDKAMPLRR